MNRSYSKIRHIQESNLRLEKRMLSEQLGLDRLSSRKGDMTKKQSEFLKARNAGSNTKNAKARAAGANNSHMFESRQAEIVREAMKVAKEKKKSNSEDKFIADPELNSKVIKTATQM